MGEHSYRIWKILTLLNSGAVILLFAVLFFFAKLYGGGDMRIILITNRFGENLVELVVLIILGCSLCAMGTAEVYKLNKEVRG